jgi:hypothetical protein
MKKIGMLGGALLLVNLSLLAACGAEDQSPEAGQKEMSSDDAQLMETMAGRVPAGPHFNLNLIGVPRDKTANITNGNRIFLKLEGRTKINLSQGDFKVLDANGTDGTGAFQLPAPDPDGDGITKYSVFARALGKPGGSITANTCAIDPATGEEVCSLETFVTTRTRGGSNFTDVSKELLSISVDIDGDGDIDRVPIFDDRLKDFAWNFDNAGLRVLQLRFIEVPSTL